MLQYIKDVREDDWDDDQPTQRLATLLVDPLVKLQRAGPLTQEVLRERGVLRPSQSLAECPIPCKPTHNDVIDYLRQCAAQTGEQDVKEGVEKVRQGAGLLGRGLT